MAQQPRGRSRSRPRPGVGVPYDEPQRSGARISTTRKWMSMIRPPTSRLVAAARLHRRPAQHAQTLVSTRFFHASTTHANVPQWPQPVVPEPPVMPSDDLDTKCKHGKDGKKGDGKEEKKHESWYHEWAHSPSFQAALTTVVGLGAVFAGGIGYLQWYKAHVLRRVEGAFAGGYDPALELSSAKSPQSSHIVRREQALIDAIFRGEKEGGYYLVIGPKGTGKGTMILDAMRSVHAEGASVCEAHPDLEVFRLRLGKALDFDFFEDWQGSLFSRADPRSGGPQLDVERAMTKLEKVAIKYTKKHGRPLVMAFTNIHLFPNTEEGHAILYQLQQRAEAWAQAGIMTMVFTTDDFWCLDKLKKNGSRMRVLSVYDLSAAEAIKALRQLRAFYLSLKNKVPMDEVQVEDDSVLRRVYETIGGRTSYITRVARAGDMIKEADDLVKMEKGWLLSKIGLIPEMDDDVMDEQKWSSCSWLLLRHMAQEAEPLKRLKSELKELTEESEDEELDLNKIHLTPAPADIEAPAESEVIEVNENTSGPKISEEELNKDIDLPRVTYDDARRLMTRTDFFEGLDHDNIITIDVNHDVRPDSMIILRAAQEVVSQEGFDEMLDQTRDRVDEIEGLHRQNELVLKSKFSAILGKDDEGRTRVDFIGYGDHYVPTDEEEGDDDGGDEEKSAPPKKPEPEPKRLV